MLWKLCSYAKSPSAVIVLLAHSLRVTCPQSVDLVEIDIYVAAMHRIEYKDNCSDIEVRQSAIF